MARIIVLGAGLNGLCTALLLARDGHRVTVLERDPAPPPDPADAWDGWERAGVNQFRQLHYLLPRWRALMAADLPDVLDDVLAAGGLRMNPLTAMPPERRGPLRADDDRFETITARRPVLEAAVAGAVSRTRGIDVRRGVTVTGVLTETAETAETTATAATTGTTEAAEAAEAAGTIGEAARVSGVLLAGGGVERADLVVDCGGRRSQLPAWLVAAGARRPVEEREDSGFAYYGRHFRGRDGRLPQQCGPLLQHYDSVSLLTLPGDNACWGVGFVVSSKDHELRSLRDADRWDAALARYPLAAHWRDGEPLGGVAALAGIEDRLRRFVVDGLPVATGVVAVGDAWACTNPSLGRGASIGLLHAGLLRDVLRELDAADPGAADKLVRRFAELTESVAEPLYRMSVWFDRHRLAELDADRRAATGGTATGGAATGETATGAAPYRPDDPRWAASKALFAASLTDPDLLRAHLSVASLLTTPAELFAQHGVLERVLQAGGAAPRYPLPGPSREELLTVLG